MSDNGHKALCPLSRPQNPGIMLDDGAGIHAWYMGTAVRKAKRALRTYVYGPGKMQPDDAIERYKERRARDAQAPVGSTDFDDLDATEGQPRLFLYRSDQRPDADGEGTRAKGRSSFARILNACHLLWLETYPAM